MNNPLLEKPIEKIAEELDKHNSINTDAAWNQLYKKILSDNRKIKLFSFIRNSAAILLPLLIIWTYAISPNLSSHKINFVNITATAGVSRIILPDSSIVWLNKFSTLSYPSNFNMNKREVNLTGEAYFKVKSDKKRRFDVRLTTTS